MTKEPNPSAGRLRIAAVVAATVCIVTPASAGSLAELDLQWPTLGELARVLTLRDYNTRVVIIGTTLLGLAAGMVGSFLLLRKRALLSDTLSHASLPGIALAFIVVTAAGGDGKHLGWLISGAVVFSVLGTLSVMAIRRYSRLKEDAALGIVLSVYFGLGIALLGMATRMESGNAAGLNAFIYGRTASMLFFDALLIAVTAALAAVACLLLYKEFTVVCFDSGFAEAQGWPVFWLDLALMTLVVVVTVVGLQAVGLILVVALLIIPPAAARFWTWKLRTMVILSALFGALSGLVGAGLSALMANLPSGAVIVLAAASIFMFSLFLGTARGIVRQSLDQWRLSRKVLRENVLRALFELDEARGGAERGEVYWQSFGSLLDARAWSVRRLRGALRELRREGLVMGSGSGADRIRLTAEGAAEASRVVRNHRLWEAYLIAHADTAAAHVDRGADAIEHVLSPDMIRRLEAIQPDLGVGRIPKSLHPSNASRVEAGS